MSRLVVERSSSTLLNEARPDKACVTHIGETVTLSIHQSQADGDPMDEDTPLGECTGFDNSVAFAHDETQTFDCVLRGPGLDDGLPCKRNDSSIC